MKKFPLYFKYIISLYVVSIFFYSLSFIFSLLMCVFYYISCFVFHNVLPFTKSDIKMHLSICSIVLNLFFNLYIFFLLLQLGLFCCSLSKFFRWMFNYYFIFMYFYLIKKSHLCLTLYLAHRFYVALLVFMCIFYFMKKCLKVDLTMSFLLKFI